LPENFAFMGSEAEKRELAEALGDAEAPIQRALSDLARAEGCALIAGGMPIRSNDASRPYNASLAFDASGELAASYRKIHLFDVELPDGTHYRESQATSPGDDVVVTKLCGWNVGLSVCYDLRFPELYRGLVRRGSELLTVPAAFTLTTGKDHWHVLLRARAVESQSYVVAAAQWGAHPHGRTTFGHAMVVDPWGTVVAECPDGEGVAIAELDRDRLAAVRSSLPSLKHQRL
jgi:predicted amidohydrolase